MKEMSCLNSIQFIQLLFFLCYELQHVKFDNIFSANIEYSTAFYLPNVDFRKINSMRNLKREFSQFLYIEKKSMMYLIHFKNYQSEHSNRRLSSIMFDFRKKNYLIRLFLIWTKKMLFPAFRKEKSTNIEFFLGSFRV